ncbi:MAG TPA: prolipoprotein diacylglyceryl transferase family protein, partial [Acidimicrobiales bacterium]|nr:prolipoprotein diacylglyceryl transferase family protein [Acidimicrobiales bacterium]
MRPIPVVFHLGPLQVHTYGIGLALTFWFALWYMRRKFDAAGLPSEWLNKAFLAVIAAAIVGARAVHVLANLSVYRSDPGEIFTIWHGGLSSFGGLLFGVPVAIWYKRRYLPELPTLAGLDLAAPVLMASWTLGRLLGPQVMIDGGGHPTSAWFGLRYACTVGKVGCVNGVSVREIPVPVFQAVECLVIWFVLVQIERRTGGAGAEVDGSGRRVPGTMVAAFLALWGMARFADEFFWLAVPRLWDAVEVTGLAMATAGWGTVAWLLARRRSAPAP